MYNLIYNNHRITFGNVNIGYELPYVSITYSTVDHGTVSGVDTALIGSTVTVTATPSSGYELSYITVNGEQIVGNSFVVTGNTVVGAVFAQIIYTVTYSSVQHGSVTGVASAAYGSTVTVTATPSSGYELSYITVNGTQIVGNSFVITGNTTVGAVFTAIAYTITYDNVTSEHCTLSGPATATVGTSVTVTVTPDSGYGLSYITVNGTQITGRSFTMPAANVTIVAVMQEYYYFGGVAGRTQESYKSTLTEPTSWSPMSGLPSSINANYYNNNPAYTSSKVDDATNLSSIRLDNDCGLWIGDNCYNGTTVPTISLGSNPILHIGNNSLNGATTALNLSPQNTGTVMWEIGSNSCTNWNLTLIDGLLLRVGSGSLRTLTMSHNEATVIFNGMPGSDQSIIPIILDSNRNRCRFNGLTQEMVKPGSTWRKIISYQGSSYFAIYCYNMTDETISWLNTNRYYFINGNYSNVEFGKGD